MIVMRIVNVLGKKKKKTLCVESFSTLFYTKRHKFVKKYLHFNS